MGRRRSRRPLDPRRREVLGSRRRRRVSAVDPLVVLLLSTLLFPSSKTSEHLRREVIRVPFLPPGRRLVEVAPHRRKDHRTRGARRPRRREPRGPSNVLQVRAVDVDLSLEKALERDGAGVSAQPRGRERRRGHDAAPPAVVVVVDDLLRGVDRSARGGLEANAAGLLLGDSAVRDGFELAAELAAELVVQLLGVLVLDVAASGESARLLVALAPDFLRWGCDCRIGETGRRGWGARGPTGGPLQPGGALGGDL
mmetsp:Transcript_3097/g.13862  ORF Transcript_3097/g.13862 Transcript_3097/m.13862 type:complete len:254 (-) Transcript_3097:455-1216(-)